MYWEEEISEPEWEEDVELKDGWPVDQLLGRKVVSEEDQKQDSRWESGTVLYLVAWEGYADDEYT